MPIAHGAHANDPSPAAGFDVRSEQRVETLVSEISGVIRAAKPEKRVGLANPYPLAEKLPLVGATLAFMGAVWVCGGAISWFKK